jgi:hypothetical protein
MAKLQAWPPKDPDEVLDYPWDWTPRGYPNDTLVTFTATTIEGTVIVDDVTDIEGLKGVVWLSGGTLNETCQVRLRCLTAAGREGDETVTIKIVSK